MGREGRGAPSAAGLIASQRTPDRAPPLQSAAALAVAALVSCLVPSASAQEGPPRGLVLAPTAAVQVTATDNYRSSSAGDRASDLVTRLSVGVASQVSTPRTQGFLDYQLSEVLYARHGSENNHQNALNARLHANMLDGRVTLDAGATIGRQTISAFGSANANAETANSNVAETRTVRVAPAVAGQVAGMVAYRGQVDWTQTSTSGQTVGNSHTTGAGLHLQPVNRAKLGWTADLQHTASGYRDGRDTSSDRVWLGSVYDWSSLDLMLGLNAGYERSNLLSLDSRSKTTWGASLAWAPSPRTRADLRYDQRQFGNSYAVQLQYRTPLTIWQASTSRDLSTGAAAMAAGARSTAYDLFFQQLASVEPDPFKRNALVLARLQQANIDPNALITVGFLTSAATVIDRSELSTAWRLARDTAVLSLVRSRSRRVDAVTFAADDLAVSPHIASTMLSLNVAHQLTPQSSLTLNVSVTDTSGEGSSQHSRYQQLALLWSANVWRDIGVSLGLRRSQSGTGSQSAAENALTASLTARF